MNGIIIPSSADYVSLILMATHRLDASIFTDEQIHQVEDGVGIDSCDSIFLSSDTLYSKIEEILPSHIKRQISFMRDKYQFRQRIKALHPHFFFKKICLGDLTSLNLSYLDGEEYIIKPSTGFMAFGSYVIDKNTDLASLYNQLKDDMRYFDKMYPGIYQDEWLVEARILSDIEIAVDMYYDCDGHANIINVYQHPKSVNPRYSQMLYYSSTELISSYHDTLVDYFDRFNADKAIKGLPIHAEFFSLDDSSLIPIEFNAARFGGMGLADLSLYAYGYNPYTTFFNRGRINWDKLTNHSDQYYVWLLAYNHSDANVAGRPNRKALREAIKNYADILDHRPLDEKKLPVFSIFYLRAFSREAIDKLLAINFDHYYE